MSDERDAAGSERTADDGTPVKPGATTESSTATRLRTYECLDCGHRTKGRTGPGACPECGGELKNLGVASEQ